MLERMKLISITLVVVLLLVLIVLNLEPTPFNILFREVKLPRAVMMFGTFAVGYLCGLVIGNPLRFLRRKS